MSISSQLHSLVGWPNRSTAAIDREIDEELDFHIDCRTRDLIESGLTPEGAAAEAERQFGPRDRIRRECQAVDYRNQARWMMALVGFCVLSIMAISWMGHLLRRAHLHNQVMESLLAAQLPAARKKAAVQTHPLDGKISDQDGKPVSGAKVLLIFKSWPNGQYQQENFEETSDADGKFQFPELYSTKMQTAFLVTVLAEGQAMQSEYLVNKKREILKPLRFKLKPAIEKTIVLTRPDGEPFADAVVFPESRQPKGSRDPFLLYHQSGEAAGYRTDADGRVKLNLFQVGDAVQFAVIDGEESVSISTTIDDKPEQSISTGKKTK